MKVLITGSSGFIGRALAPVLSGAGHDVVGLARAGGASTGSGPRWDPAAGTIDPIEGFDAVVHLAGVGIGSRRWSAAHKARILDSRVRGTRLLAEALAGASHPPKVLVSASAIGYYGDRGEEILTEDAAPGKGFLAGVCVQWEDATAPAAEAGIRVVRIRTGLVLDGGGGMLGPMLIPFRLGLGGRVGPGRQWWSWIALPDHVRAVAHLLDDGSSGPVNLAAPNPVRNSEFTAILASVLRRPAVVPVPAAALRVALGSEMAADLILASQRVEPARLLQSRFEFSHPDLPGALRAVLAR